MMATSHLCLKSGSGVDGNPIYGIEESLALGLNTDFSLLQVAGLNANINSTDTLIWELSTAYSEIPSAQIIKISSNSALDNSVGTGARTVLIEGLDANYLEINEIVTLSGFTGVNTVNQYLRINRLTVITAGNTNTNQGRIYAGIGTVSPTGINNNPQSIIAPTHSISHVGRFTTAANKTFYIKSVEYIGGRDSQPMQFKMNVRGPISTNNVIIARSITTAREYYNDNNAHVVAIPEKTDVWATVVLLSGSGSSPVAHCYYSGFYGKLTP